MLKDHYDGFEKERTFHKILGFAVRECNGIQAKTIEKIIEYVAPDFLDGLFEIRRCVRQLKYIGCGCNEDECPTGGDFFKPDEIYESIDFTGATYSIKGYIEGEARIGSSYFEWIE